MSNEENEMPFGDKWFKEMMKHGKPSLINLLKEEWEKPKVFCYLFGYDEINRYEDICGNDLRAYVTMIRNNGFEGAITKYSKNDHPNELLDVADSWTHWKEITYQEHKAITDAYEYYQMEQIKLTK